MFGKDKALASERVQVAVATEVHDRAAWRCDWTIERWDEEQTAWLKARLERDPLAADFERARMASYLTTEVAGNLLTTVGLNRLTNLLIGGGAQALTNTSARLGVGNGAGSAAVGDTDLSASAGSANRWFQVMDATYPQQSNGVLTVKSTFASADGNFAWNELGIDIGTPTVTSAATVNALLFNHKTSIAQGTKASGQSWAATATVTIA